MLTLGLYAVYGCAGNASRPTSAYTYNPPDVDSSSISGQLGAEGSTDDVLAELLGLPQTSPQSLPEVFL